MISYLNLKLHERLLFRVDTTGIGLSENIICINIEVTDRYHINI